MLKQRIVTASFLILIILASIYFLPTRYFTWIISAFTLLGAWEWSALSGFTSKLARTAYLFLFVVLFFVLSLLPAHFALEMISGMAIGWWLWALVWIIQFQRQTKQFHRNTYAFAFIGICVLLPFWYGIVTLHLHQSIQLNAALLFHTQQQHILLFIILLVVIADTAAYFAGKKWGKHKLASRVSPGKTWEGLIGALFAITILIAPLAQAFGIDKFSREELFGLAVIILLFALIGDLFESVIKRLANVKDSGNLLPGHGGIMDRIDSYTAVIPIFVAIYFLW